ncbi:probable cytochrome P450 6a13 [Sipha flava]|uniref:Probable cytochrome P450 6a13 n=1 Tax=Sipha flava TaxID=143950 RepID=A0A8B8G4S3_9HEMI|nr:probable cytochrome P450 6a13 [Sipha flava]
MATWTDCDGWWLLAAALMAAAAIAYLFCTSTYGYWRDRKVPWLRPTVPLFGNLTWQLLGMERSTDMIQNAYNAFSGHRYGGIYQMRMPFLIVRDPVLINRMLIKDFTHFTDHGLYKPLPTENRLANGLFIMNGDQWKTMRAKLSPGFASSKLKHMHGQMKECGEELMRNVAGVVATGGHVFEVRDVLGRYATDVIGTCAFGLQLNTINDDQSPFRRYGKTVFKPSLRVLLSQIAWMVSPALRRALHVYEIPLDTIEFFDNTFTDTVRYRERNNVVRDDLMQSLIKARDDLVVNKTVPSVKFEETDILANAFLLFAVGFETVSTAASLCLYELALHKQIQDRVREEINTVKFKYNGEMNNEFLIDLQYLEMVLAETMRKYPPVSTLFREATKDYQVPDDTLVIEKGTKVLIPVHALHHDPEFYPDPQAFDPERFTPEEKAKRPSGTYLPFGDGPRICIGKRFSEMEMKLALTEILIKYEVEPCDKTEIPITFSMNAVANLPANGVWLKFKPIQYPK